MYLNKTEKLLFFFVVFLNFIPLNKAQAHSRGTTYSKTIDWGNKAFLKRKQSLNITLNKSLKNTINTYQRNLISDMELEINYSGNKKESKFNIFRDNKASHKFHCWSKFYNWLINGKYFGN